MTPTNLLTAPAECAASATHAISTEAATTVATVLKSLSDPLRLRMLSAIATNPRGEACVCDLSELADVSQPTISHHLKVMKETGILASERRGTWVYYRIVSERRTAVTALLDAMREVGIDITAERPKILTTDAVRPIRDEIRYRIAALVIDLLS